jgi:hypothetical protein
MNDQQSFEREVAIWVAAEGTGTAPDQTLDDILAATSRKRPLPAWLALIKEPPMRISNSLAVGSPMVRIAAIMVATLLLALVVAGAGIAGSRLLASDGTIVVAADGSGDFTSINEAVEAAADGDTLLIRPGIYVESVRVAGKDLTIRGDGDRADIVVEAALSASPDVFGDWERYADEMGWAFYLQDTDSLLSNITVVNPHPGVGITVAGQGAAPTLEALDVRSTTPWDDLHPADTLRSPITWTQSTGGTLRDSIIEGYVVVALDADVVLEGNQMTDTCLWILGPDGHATLRDNVVRGCPFEFAVRVSGSATVEGNDLSVAEDQLGVGYSARGSVVVVDSFPNVGNHTVIRANDIHDGTTGVEVFPNREVDISDNRLHDLVTGMSVSASEAHIAHNVVTATGTGVFVVENSPALESNVIEGNEVGLRVGLAQPVLTGNRICDNETNLQVTGRTQPSTEGNEICPDDPA